VTIWPPEVWHARYVVQRILDREALEQQPTERPGSDTEEPGIVVSGG